LKKNTLPLLTAAFLLAACTTPLNAIPTVTPTSAPTITPATTPTTIVLPSSSPAASYQFVTNKLIVPVTQADAQHYALDLDGDGRPDNLFGQAFALLSSLAPGLDLQSTVNQGVSSGQIVMLHRLQTNDLVNSPNASWSILPGLQTQSAPKFDGSDMFTLDASVQSDSLISGAVAGSHFTGGPGSAHIQMIVLGEPVQLNLIGVRIEADVNKNGCSNGRLGGGISVNDFQNSVLPAIAAGANNMVASDKGCQAGCSNPAKVLLQVLDTDKNGTVTVDELKGNLLLNAAISPDLDLLDASGKFNPRQDGVKDALSLGLGFSCVAAGFSAPAN